MIAVITSPAWTKASRRLRPAQGIWEGRVRRSSGDEEGEVELAKNAGHLALLTFKLLVFN
jgi:hypothetical protein